MVWIDRPAISPDVALVTVCFLLFLTRAVAVLAQRLQLAVLEQPCIAFMGRDMVRHRGGGSDLPLQAHGAERMFSELQLGPTLPAPGVVEVVPATGLVWHEV